MCVWACEAPGSSHGRRGGGAALTQTDTSVRPGQQRCVLEVFDLPLKKVENRIRKGGWVWVLKALTGRPGACSLVHDEHHHGEGGEVGPHPGPGCQRRHWALEDGAMGGRWPKGLGMPGKGRGAGPSPPKSMTGRGQRFLEGRKERGKRPSLSPSLGAIRQQERKGGGRRMREGHLRSRV